MQASNEAQHPNVPPFNDILKQGKVKIKSKKTGIWKQYWAVLKKPSSKGPLRLEKYASEKTFITCDCENYTKFLSLQSISSTAILENSRHTLIIEISTCSRIHTSVQISTDSEYEMKNWCDELQQATHQYGHQYEEFIESDMFNVNLLPSPLQPFHGEHVLKVTDNSVILLELSTHAPDDYLTLKSSRPLIVWPLKALRKYGRVDTKFTIESGRSCPTGEGLYIFDSYQAEQINERVHRASRSIAASLGMINRQRSHGSVSSDSSFEAQMISSDNSNDKKSEKKKKHSLSGRSLFKRKSKKSDRPLPPIPSLADLECS